MQLHDNKLEIRLLRTICESTNRHEASRILASLVPGHFYDDGAKEIFTTGIRKYARKHGSVPNWSDVCTNVQISEPVRDEARQYKKIKPLQDTDEIRRAYASAEQFRKLRVLYFTATEAVEILSGDSVDVEELYMDVTDKLVRTQVGTLSEREILQVGGGKSVKSSIANLFDRPRDNVVPTGLTEFDVKNGGWMKGSLVVLAATTGGGKTAMMVQLSKSQAEMGYSAHVVPLEMTEDECLARYAANVSGVDVRKFLFVPFTKNERKATERKWSRWEKKVSSTDRGRLRIYEPEEDMSIEEILTILEPYDDDIIYIDYIGLLKGVDGDDSWRQLGAAARYAKMWAKRRNKIVVLLAQLSDEGSIRYSKAIKDHANNFWAWVYSEENRESGLLDIMQQKARNQQAFDFQLLHDFSTMRIGDVEDEKVEKMRTKEGSSRREKLKRALRDAEGDDVKRYLGDLSDG